MKSLLFVILITLFSIPALAQDISESHLQASEELLVQMNMQEVMNQAIDDIIDAQLRQAPDLLPFEDILKSFMQKHMSWENLRDVYVQIYAEQFTESELREITAFYQTETGQKAVRLTPVLMQKGMMIGEQVVAENLPELEQLLDERMREMGGYY